ncbi:hypothetical protein L1049_001247 [Liquidambar formosana]|uniref:BZIP domain-containing protein n=1 Tax=Liquidambar formosana TaxID=63359 RepID=A0AAP0R440_LIQFO
MKILSESQENWMRMKRQRGLDGESMDISKWSGSSHFQMNGVANVVESIGSASFGVGYGGGDGYRYYRNYPYGPYSTNGFGVKNANEVSVQRTVGLDGMETPASEKVRRRMIKNRESAARSRARKLAHNAQLQIEIMELKKENELLRRVMKVLSVTVRTKSENMPTSSRAFSEPL